MSLLLLVGALASPLSSPALGQPTSFELPGGDMLVVEGEDFTFERTLVIIDGEEVFEERAIWEGGVTARFGEIVLQTEHIEATFDGPEVSRLEAGPQVIVTGLGGRARFDCADIVIDLPTAGSDLEVYRGMCRDVHGYYLADAVELGLEGTGEYEVNFTADVARLEPEVAVLEWPCISLGDIERPDLAISSRAIRFNIGLHPETGERAILGAQAANLSVRLFGYRLNLIPFPVGRGFFAKREPGLSYPLPRIGWEGDEGLRWDQSAAYDFAVPSVDEGPRLRFRLDAFPFDRSYPEIGADVQTDGLIFGVRAGYRREEDPNGYSVATRAEPHVLIDMVRAPLGDTGFGFRAGAFWGHLRDMGYGLDLDRWGYRTVLDHRGLPLGDLRLSGRLHFKDLYYQGGGSYRVLDGRVRLRYVDPPHWGASLTYRRIAEWGLPEFRFDVPQVIEEIGLREQTRLSRRWGAGFDWAWDLARDEYERQECHLTYIFDSFQVSLGWDFAGETAKVQFALPGSLR